MSKYAAGQPPRRQPGADVDSLSSGVATVYEELWTPEFQSLNEGLRVVCLDHARGKVSETDLTLTYHDHDPPRTPAKSTNGHFCCITGVAFQNEGRGLETYCYVVEKGDINYVLRTDPTDANTTADESTATKTYEVCVKANSKTQYLLRPRDLPSPELCLKSCRELYERAVRSVHGEQPPAPQATQSLSTPRPTAQSTSHGNEFCRPLADSVTKVSCRVPRFTDMGKRVKEFEVVEFFLVEGGWYEDQRRYKVPVATDDQYVPLDVPELDYYCFSLHETVLSSCWAQGLTSNVPTEPAPQSCKNFDSHIPALDKGHSSVIDVAPSTSSKPKRTRTDEQKAQRKKMDSREKTPTSIMNRKVLLPKDLTTSPFPSPPAETASTHKPTCSVCLSKFASRKGLNAHRQTHDKNRPSFACDVCDKTFTRPSDMERHKENHKENHKEKAYSCERCDRVLSRADSLLCHKRICRGRP
ncbi:hypothetical protein BGZ97_007303 [Linnemannia gamsii]|uniref:C2H2-type domain-containing protein n=1 Tax=Linnemannia gamsii TaxID=64522 RepID=A0A9P6REY4_9FUNG|nr:hypothetical protein BGZ97_007303 [Linnemannia gamsii]